MNLVRLGLSVYHSSGEVTDSSWRTAGSLSGYVCISSFILTVLDSQTSIVVTNNLNVRICTDYFLTCKLCWSLATALHQSITCSIPTRTRRPFSNEMDPRPWFWLALNIINLSPSVVVACFPWDWVGFCLPCHGSCNNVFFWDIQIVLCSWS